MSKDKKPSLTEKQELFAIHYIISGGNATAAYKEVYNVGEDTKDTTVYVNSHKVLNNAKVSQRVHELQMMEYSSNVLTIEEIKQMLTDRAKTSLDKDGLKAVDMLNKMGGHYEKDNAQKKSELHIPTLEEIYGHSKPKS